MVYLTKVELGDTRGRGLSPAAVVLVCGREKKNVIVLERKQKKE